MSSENGNLPGIGARLKAAREARNLSRVVAAQKLRVDPTVIDAIEDERFGSLGPPVYVRGHLRHYSELVGEPASEILTRYAELADGTEAPDLTRIVKAERRFDLRKLAVPAGMIALAALLAGAVWWVLHGTPLPLQRVSELLGLAPASTASTVATPPATAPPPVEVPALPAAAGSAAVPVDASLEGAPSTLASPAASTTAGELPDTASGSSVSQPSIATTAGPTDAPASTSSQAAARPARALTRLRLSFPADSWVEIHDANGRELFFDVAGAHSAHVVEGAGPLRVVLGNAEAVQVEVNGAPATIPENARRDGGARFVVNRSGTLVRSRQ